MHSFKGACLTLALFLGLSVSAQAAITRVNWTALHNQAASTTNQITVSGTNCPAGSLIILLAAYATVADTLSSVADSGSNSYTVIENPVGTGVGLGIAYAFNTANVANGGTVTATFAGSVTSETIAECFTGIATTSPLDIHNKSATGLAATTATTVNSGTLNATNEVVFGLFVGVSNAGSVTCNGSFSSGQGAGSVTPASKVCYQIVAATTSIPFTPTWVNANNYVTDLVSFSATAIGATVRRGTLMGVGP